MGKRRNLGKIERELVRLDELMARFREYDYTGISFEGSIKRIKEERAGWADKIGKKDGTNGRGR